MSATKIASTKVKLPAPIASEVQRILDAEARRLLAEKQQAENAKGGGR